MNLEGRYGVVWFARLAYG